MTWCFWAPPYRMAEAYGDALSRLLAMGALGEGCRIVMERAREQAIALPEGFARVDARAITARRASNSWR